MLVIPNFIGFNSSRMVKVKTKAEKALLLPVPPADEKDVAAPEVGLARAIVAGFQTRTTQRGGGVLFLNSLDEHKLWHFNNYI